jgi:hypothetical protein
MKSLFTRATAAVGLCAVSFGVLAQAAEARVSGPRLDSLSIFCGQLQDEADRLLSEYPNASPSRKDEILTRLREIGRTWYGDSVSNGICDAVFGDIVIVPGGSGGGRPPVNPPVTQPTIPGTYDPHP